MATSRTDMYWLGQDPGFQHKVQSSFLDRCAIVSLEGFSIAFHRERQRFVVQSLATPQALANAVSTISFAVATDSSVIADATIGGTVPLTDSASAALGGVRVTDAHIDSAVSGQFNQYSMQPDN